MRVIVGRTVGREDRYDCRVCHRVSRQQYLVDDLVRDLVVARLSQDDIHELLADTAGDDDTRAAAAKVAKLRADLAETREKVDAGELSLDDLAFFRKRWEKRIADAERRARPRWLPDEVFEVAGPHAADRWEKLSIHGKRTILGALFTVTIHPAGKGHWRFDPELIEITWRGRNHRP
jgi:hypothetical protein